MIELPEDEPELCLLGMDLSNAVARESVEDAEFLLAQALVTFGENPLGAPAGRLAAVGWLISGNLPNQWPSARACRSPRLERGTSMSRRFRSILAARARYAASRATLPALSP